MQSGKFRILKLCCIACVIGLIICIMCVHQALNGQIRFIAPPPTPFFEDCHGNYLSEGLGKDETKGYWDAGETLPDRIVQCVIAIEDNRFYEHTGIDPRGLVRAFINNLTHDKRQGGSTIAMQLARMQDPGPRTYWKKISEIIIARALIKEYGHEAVLRHYLRLIPQGNNIHGAAYAARRYFAKPLKDLGWGEAALLTSLIREPGSMNVFTHQGFIRASKRARLILDLLHRQDKIDAETMYSGLSQLKCMDLPVRESRPVQSYHAIMCIEEALGKRPGKIYTRPVRTTIDLTMQDRLWEAAYAAMNVYRPMGAGNVAIVIAERPTGKVRGYLGSEFYEDEVYAGAINYARTKRSSGSILKPFIYALGLAENRFSPWSVLADIPLTVSTHSGVYRILNYDGGYLGPLVYRKALANSRNVPAIQVLQSVGAEKTLDFFKYIGLTEDGPDVSYYGLGLAIGGLYVRLEDLVQAYGILANDGRRYRLKWFEGEEDQDGVQEQIIPEDCARQITCMLSDPLARLPSFNRMCPLEYPFPVAVKTGTSQGFRDAWAVAYSNEYIVGAWIGHPNNDPMKQVSGIAAAGLVRKIMLDLHPMQSSGIDEKPFKPPQGYHSLRICPISGEKATELCQDALIEYFAPGDEPVKSCSVHKRYAVNKNTGNIAGPDTPPELIEMRTYVVLPPEYAQWADSKDYDKPVQDTSVNLAETSIAIKEPASGARYLIDQEIPLRFQTIELKASVFPAVEEIQWLIDGKPSYIASYPYVAYWNLEPGAHTFQARFTQAAVYSDVITIQVYGQ